MNVSHGALNVKSEYVVEIRVLGECDWLFSTNTYEIYQK